MFYTQNSGKKKGVVGINLLRLLKFGALPDLNWGPADYEFNLSH